MRKLKLTPEWVLKKLPHTHYADGDGNVSVYTNDATDANFIELALDSLHIHYEAYDYLDGNDDFVFGFDFRLEDIRDECPLIFHTLKEIDRKEMNNNVLSHQKTISR